MAATPSVKVVKTITYRGVARKFSNRYHFNGGTPADTAHWNTLFDAITNIEKGIYPSFVEIVEAVGYAAGSDVPVASKTYAIAGALGAGAASRTPGDAAILLRYATTARTPKNHPVYLFNYFHGVMLNSISDGDTPWSSQVSAVTTFANDWMAGFSDGTNTYVRAGPNGATAVGAEVEQYITHRDFPR